MMPRFKELIQIEGTEEHEKTHAKKSVRDVQPRAAATTHSKGFARDRGCESCSLNRIKGINKIFGKVRGKDIFVWAQSPGPVENKEGRELLGPAGKWLWAEFAAAAIKREECDIQNVVRCFPADRDEDEWPPLKMRNPTKEEIHCCSIYNEQALEKSKAKVHIVLGQVAAKILLGSEYSKDRRIFWSKRIGCKVVCLDHPAFFIRRGGKSVAPNDPRLIQFRRDLRYAAQLSKGTGGRYGFLRAQKYVGITTIKMARRAYREIVEMGRLHHRVSADLEEGKVDKHGKPTKDNSGRRVPLVYGFSGKSGTAYVFPLDQPDAPVTDKVRRYCKKIVRKLLTSPNIKFIFHHGSYDVKATKELLGFKIVGYDYDTNYAEFFVYPERHSFALDNIAMARYPEFSGYKTITAPEAFTTQALEFFKKSRARNTSLEERYTLARKKIKNGLNYALVPWKKMVLYNGADNDLQKRIERHTAKKISLPLLHVYQDAQFVMEMMEKLPPLFDYKQYDRLSEYYPVVLKHVKRRICRMVGNKEFNPSSPQQVSNYLYKVLRLPVLGEKPDTTKETMVILSEYHKFPKLVVLYRKIKKICSTYLAGFKASADYNAGRCRTIWWLTGTRTGRMSSGGGDSGEDGIVNLQNIHGFTDLQNLLISDRHWRAVYLYWKEHGDFTRETWQRFADLDIFLGFDHSQMELRCVAQKSGDKNLIAAFHSGVDIHSQVGHELTGWPVEKIKNDEATRRLIKNMQFGIVYGINEDKLADYMRAKGVKDVDDKKVKKFFRLYFERFSGVARMIESDREFVKKYGYCETLFGFVRKLTVNDNAGGGAYWGNQAINTPIQGTAHQLMLMGLVPLKRKPQTYKLLRQPQLEIHDAIYFIVKLKVLFEAAKLGQQMLEKDALRIVKNDFGIDWKVPLKAEPKGALRFGVQVKDIGSGGPKTEWEFLNVWCQKNREHEIKFTKERKKMLAEVS
jgi:uracil-DNA glycosylase family 4